MKQTMMTWMLIALLVVSAVCAAGMVAPAGAIKNTWMVYSCGDNNLEGSEDVKINNMVAGGGSTNDVTIIAMLDRSGTDNDGIYNITGTGRVKIWTPPGELDMGDPATLAQLISFARTNYPADRYILSMPNHGGGYKYPYGVRGISYDDYPSHHLDIADLGDCLDASGTHFALVYLDVCLEDMVEVGYELRNSVDVMVASEEITYGGGTTPYTALVLWLKANPTASAASFGEQIVNGYMGNVGPDSNQTMAAVDLTRMSAVALSIDTLGDLLIANMPAWQSAILASAGGTERYSASEFADINDFMDKLDAHISNPQLQSATAAVRTDVDAAVLFEQHKGTGVQDSHGLSTWICGGSLATAGFADQLQEYHTLAFASATSWDQFNIDLMKTPTSISALTADPESPYAIDTFTLSGSLSSDDGAVVGETVALQKWNGVSWILTGVTAETGGGGAFAISTHEDTSGVYTYRAHYAGCDEVTHLYFGSDSPPLSVTVQKIPTQLSGPIPSSDTPLINTPFTLNGTLEAEGLGVSGKIVHLWRSTNSGSTWTDTLITATTLGPDGKYTFTITETVAGYLTYKVTFDGDPVYEGSVSNPVTVRINRPPDVSLAQASEASLWSPHKNFISETILGVTDPDGDPITITITGITSDEATSTTRGAGGSKSAPDAFIIGGSALIRAERSGEFDGRVYALSFTADDGYGGMTPGGVCVQVPLDTDSLCIDSGQWYDATAVN